MVVKFIKQSGRKFFEFNGEFTISVDGWLDPLTCPSFCTPSTQAGFEPISNTGVLTLLESDKFLTFVCPTSFGYISRHGFYSKVGPYHCNLVLEKSGFRQYLYSFSGGSYGT